MAPLHTRKQVKKGPRRQKDHTVSPYVEPPASAFRMENVSYLQGRKVNFEPYRPQAIHRLGLTKSKEIPAPAGIHLPLDLVPCLSNPST